MEQPIFFTPTPYYRISVYIQSVSLLEVSTVALGKMAWKRNERAQVIPIADHIGFNY